MRRGLALVVMLGVAAFTAPDARATAQIPDRIELDGRIHRLTVNPLEAWLEAHPEVSIDRLSGEVALGMCSANWRGYLATFTVADGQLMLDRVVADACTEGDPDARPDLVPQLFGGRDAVPVEWFTGLLVVPTGERVRYVHMGYGSLYSEYRLFRVERGRVLEEARMDDAQYLRYRDAQFAEWQKTREYRKQYAELTDPARSVPWTREDAEGFLYTVDVDYTTRFALPFDVADAAE